MARIALLGASSQLARDLTARLAVDPANHLRLFSRSAAFLPYGSFGAEPYDAVINFVGAGDPAKVAALGGEIFPLTAHYDTLVLDYLRRFPACRYLFLSSGAIYGGGFTEPVTERSLAQLPINQLLPQDYYAAAKLYAECRHRAQAEMAIIDLRVFSYFSRSQDLAGRFFLCDVLRALRAGQTLSVSSQPMVRDYIHPQDFHALILALLAAPPSNDAIDVYSRAPIDKLALLATFADQFGLAYRFTDAPEGVNGTGAKQNYFSLNHRAARFGYQPTFSSLDGLCLETAALLAGS